LVPIAWKGLLVAGLITIIGAIAGIGFLLIQWPSSSIGLVSQIGTFIVEGQATYFPGRFRSNAAEAFKPERAGGHGRINGLPPPLAASSPGGS
jgi:hypothetical protein